MVELSALSRRGCWAAGSQLNFYVFPWSSLFLSLNSIKAHPIVGPPPVLALFPVTVMKYLDNAN